MLACNNTVSTAAASTAAFAVAAFVAVVVFEFSSVLCVQMNRSPAGRVLGAVGSDSCSGAVYNTDSPPPPSAPVLVRVRVSV